MKPGLEADSAQAQLKLKPSPSLSSSPEPTEAQSAQHITIHHWQGTLDMNQHIGHPFYVSGTDTPICQ